MSKYEDVHIHTGKELLDSGIVKFKVHNGAWIGELEIVNNRPHLYCKDFRGNLVNSFDIHNNSILDLEIEPWVIRRELKIEMKKCGRCGIQINDVDPKFRVNGLPVNSVSLRTPINTTACECYLCHQCARDLFHFLCNDNEVEVESED